jgi:hypothetical protein
MSYDLGYIDLAQRTLQTIDNPFGTRLQSMSPVQIVTYVFGLDKFGNGAPERIRTPDPQIRSLVLYPAELPVRIEAKILSSGWTTFDDRSLRCGAVLCAPDRALTYCGPAVNARDFSNFFSRNCPIASKPAEND